MLDFQKKPHTAILIKTSIDILDSPDGKEYTHHYRLIFKRII